MPSAHPPSPPRVLVYARAGCHLCDDAEAIVARVCAELGVAWRAVPIDDDPALLAAYAELIPVVQVDGAQIAQWRITEEDLRKGLTSGK